MFKVNNRNARIKCEQIWTNFTLFLLLTLNKFHTVFIVDFEHVIVAWENATEVYLGAYQLSEI